MYSCSNCSVVSDHFCMFRGLQTGRLTKWCYGCRTRQSRNFLDLLPESLLSDIYALAGGRPVHPSARVMAMHVAETRNRLQGVPCFFESPGWDMTRMLRRHGWKKLKDGRWAGNHGRTQKCTLPERPREPRLTEPAPAGERVPRKELICMPQRFYLGPLA